MIICAIFLASFPSLATADIFKLAKARIALEATCCTSILVSALASMEASSPTELSGEEDLTLKFPAPDCSDWFAERDLRESLKVSISGSVQRLFSFSCSSLTLSVVSFEEGAGWYPMLRRLCCPYSDVTFINEINLLFLKFVWILWSFIINISTWIKKRKYRFGK